MDGCPLPVFVPEGGVGVDEFVGAFGLLPSGCTGVLINLSRFLVQVGDQGQNFLQSATHALLVQDLVVVQASEDRDGVDLVEPLERFLVLLKSWVGREGADLRQLVRREPQRVRLLHPVGLPVLPRLEPCPE